MRCWSVPIWANANFHHREFNMNLAHMTRKCILASLAVLATVGFGGCASTQNNGQTVRLTPEQLAAIKAPPNPKVPLAEVIELSKAATPPATIISKLQETGTFYNLTPGQIVDLNAQGVDQSVINHLVDAQEKARQATLITQLADRDAQQAQALQRERARRQALQNNYYGGYSPWGPSYGFGYSRGYYYDPFFRSWRGRW
jgi:multidrug efflux pump subunit AcrA (membrane-fusion protein)